MDYCGQPMLAAQGADSFLPEAVPAGKGPHLSNAKGTLSCWLLKWS